MEKGSVYYKPRGEWWDGYDNQKTVIIDDFYGWMKYDELLRIMDRYPHRVPIKGGYINFTSEYLTFTSNISPNDWYHGEWFKEWEQKALERRIDCIECFI